MLLIYKKVVKLKEYNDGDVVYGELDICGWCVLKCQNNCKNKLIQTCIYDIQKIHKESYVDGIMIWVPLNTDILRQTLFVGTHAHKRFFRGKQIDTLSLKKTYDTLFDYVMILLNKEYNFSMDDYKSFRHNLMRNDGFIEKNQIEHRDFKIP